MPVCRDNKHNNFGIVNAIDQTMFFGDTTTPAVFWLSLQLLRMTSTCPWMLSQFSQKSLKLLESLGLALFQTICISQSLFRKANNITHLPIRLRKSVKLSPGSMAYVRPSRKSASAFSIFAKNSSLDMSVEFSFSFTSFATYLASRFINCSLSAIAPISCQSFVFCAFSCTAVINLLYM